MKARRTTRSKIAILVACVVALASIIALLAPWVTTPWIGVYHTVVVRVRLDSATEAEMLAALKRQPRVLPQHLFIKEGPGLGQRTLGFMATRSLLNPGLPFSLYDLCDELAVDLVCLDCEREEQG